MIEIKKFFDAKNVALTIVVLTGFVTFNVAIAQKSSGVLDSDDVKTYSTNVEQINDTVTKDAASAGNAVRFLLRPIREADISPNMTGTVSKIHFNVGQRFNKGDTLISMRWLINLNRASMSRKHCIQKRLLIIRTVK